MSGHFDARFHCGAAIGLDTRLLRRIAIKPRAAMRTMEEANDFADEMEKQWGKPCRQITMTAKWVAWWVER